MPLNSDFVRGVQRQNEGPQGIKSVEFDANGDLNDSSYYGTDESYEHLSQDESIDLAAKDTTIDRNIISAKESGLGVAFKDNLPSFLSVCKSRIIADTPLP